jgi:hypothetical protein
MRPNGPWFPPWPPFPPCETISRLFAFCTTFACKTIRDLSIMVIVTRMTNISPDMGQS